MTSQQQLSDRTAQVLRERILTGELPPGHRLPPERQLSTEFGISRTALREALQALEGMGLVEAQVGRCRFVRAGSSATRGVEQLSNWLQMYRSDVADLSEIRQMLEPRALARTPDDRLTEVVTGATDVLARQDAAVARSDLQRAGELDAEFHTCLVKECQNRSLRVLARGADRLRGCRLGGCVRGARGGGALDRATPRNRRRIEVGGSPACAATASSTSADSFKVRHPAVAQSLILNQPPRW